MSLGVGVLEELLGSLVGAQRGARPFEGYGKVVARRGNRMDRAVPAATESAPKRRKGVPPRSSTPSSGMDGPTIVFPPTGLRYSACSAKPGRLAALRSFCRTSSTPTPMPGCCKIRGAELVVDVENTTLTLPDGREIAFEMDKFARYCLVEGLNQLGYLQKQLGKGSG